MTINKVLAFVALAMWLRKIEDKFACISRNLIPFILKEKSLKKRRRILKILGNKS
jgi:hypothetical protein